jgi:hypothetical protein
MNTETLEGITRRQLITTVAVGGAALAAGAVGGAVLGNTGTLARAESELQKLRALVALYEQLEQVGIDGIIGSAMNIIRTALDTIKTGVRLARDGMSAAENALKNLQALLDNLRGLTDGATAVLNDLSKKFQTAEALISAMLGAAQPVGESIVAFFNAILGKIPLGIGDDIRRTVTALVDLVRAISPTLDAVSNQLLKPLRVLFFPATGDAAVKLNLVDPLKQNLLAPLGKFLADVDSLLERWDTDFVAPVQAALDQRAGVRKQIALLRDEIGLA